MGSEYYTTTSQLGQEQWFKYTKINIDDYEDKMRQSLIDSLSEIQKEELAITIMHQETLDKSLLPILIPVIELKTAMICGEGYLKKSMAEHLEKKMKL